MLLGPANPRTTVSYTSEWVQRGALRVDPDAKSEEKPQVVSTLFKKFLTYQTYRFPITAYGSPEVLKGGFVYGPGHHSAALAALMLDSQGKPLVCLKTGDLRYSRVGRGEPYMLDGSIAGRLDKGDTTSDHIALGELSEEVGGEVVGDSFRPLGGALAPTMPLESTECDRYFSALVKISQKPTGDGGKMEVPGLIGAKMVSVGEAWKAFDSGQVSDASRAQTLYGRAMNSMGYLRTQGVYVQDYPKLLERYHTLALGAPWDPRQTAGDEAVYHPALSKPSSVPKFDAVVEVKKNLVPVDPGEMVDAVIRHAVTKGGKKVGVGESFDSQYLKLPYDRLKLAEYFVDPEKGPMVRFSRQFRPPLRFAPGRLRDFRRDVTDAPLDRGADFAKALKDTVELGRPCGASSGQSDLYYHFGATKVDIPEKPTGEGYVTLAEAIKECRSGEGDAQTEALLWRLADHLRWNPNLGMSWDDIDRAISSAAPQSPDGASQHRARGPEKQSS